ncbi:MAG: acyl-CoA dehydrogenase C-terminal domain-containing protein [Alphaproteobacteria bacterium]|nr:acyl-CoA dehydrogenase C-terminal domain-containing protein [Alphaproteobacteria bacterium]
MPIYRAPLRDFQFLTDEFLNVAQYKDVPGVGDVDTETVNAIWAEGARFCEEVLLPINQVGDKEGCTFKDGTVTLPTGFKEAYETYVQSGWTSFVCDPAYGGQGMPEWTNMPVTEMICSANLSFGLTPGLTHGAYNAIFLHGTDELKPRYLPKMTSGEWSGVMDLTEPHAGTDLGMIRTKAEPAENGTYKITGTKIFISAGEQNVTENIIHLVLAKLPGAPAGTKGISLFLVPKFLVNDDGSLGARNAVTCGSIEHKMGIHASPTCVINLDGATGYLLGEMNKGMKAMFTMMNAARIYVGVQGLGLGEVAYQNGAAYAKERLQMRAPTGAKFPEKPADPIIVHPDVRRMLLTMRAFAEGGRALVMEIALKLDLSHKHPDAKEREAADDFVQLMTPIVKSYLTDGGFENANLAVQVYGGHGYIAEHGIEQFVRDARIAQIYEGTNGIQALDLIGRKIPMGTGKYLRQVFYPMDAFMEQQKNNEAMKEFVKPLGKHITYLQQASLWLGAAGVSNPDDAAGGATEYARMFAMVYVGFLWARMAALALAKLEAGTDEKDFYEAKLETARFYIQRILPQSVGILATITNGAKSIMGMKAESF